MTATSAAPEMKALGTDVTGAFDEFMNAFEAFKDANDDRLGQIEKRMASDVITIEKVDRISKVMDEQKQALDRLVLKANRPPLGRETGNAEPSEHKQAFDAYVRRGDERSLGQLEAKAMSVGTAADGGYLVPERDRWRDRPPAGCGLACQGAGHGAAGFCRTHVLKKPFSTNRALTTGWAAETAARTETAIRPVLTELSVSETMELYAMPAATQTSLLDDAAVDIENWIASEVEAVAFAEQESAQPS